MLELNQIYHRYGPQLEFEFSLKLNTADSLAIIGPSGAGKSTLLDLISGFVSPSKGNIIFAQEDITHLSPGKRPTNMLFQENNLFSHLNIFDNIAIALNSSLNINQAQKELVEHALERVMLAGFFRRFPHQLSSGQKQRVALARIIVRQKPILLLDEPFSFLDPPLRIEMLDLVKSLQKEHSFIMLMVTHNYSDAVRSCNKTCFVQNGQILHFSNTEKFIESTTNPLIKSYTC